MKLKELRRCIDITPDYYDDFDVSVKYSPPSSSPGHTWCVETSETKQKVNIIIYEETMEDNPTFAGIGSMCYIIPKDDLHPDTLTPKEGKAWSKIDVNKSYSISVDVQSSDDFKPFEIPIERERQLFSHESLTSEQLHKIADFAMPVDVFAVCKDGQMQHIGNVDPSNITVRFNNYVPHFRRRRLHNKYVKKLARFIVIRDPDRIISSRKASRILNRAIKQLKKNNYDKH